MVTATAMIAKIKIKTKGGATSGIGKTTEVPTAFDFVGPDIRGSAKPAE
jgi:hypothetical protein